jgi:hypothetical protein
MRRAPASLLLVLAAFAVGCAAPGEPTARHPVVPAAVTDLAARQVGGETILSFTLPTRSTDGEPLAERSSIEVFRTAIAPGAAVDRKTPWDLAYAIPSERVDAYLKTTRAEFHDPLTPAILGGPAGSQLAYLVRTRASRARASGESNVVTLHIYLPPAAPANVRASVAESAVTIRWGETSPPAGATFGGYHVYRTRVIPEQAGASAELLGTATTAEYQDAHFEVGETYAYTVRSAAMFGADVVESADSVAASVTTRDVFPPAAPVGLEAAIVPATPQAGSYVELSWAISPESDLAGYRVYRSDREDATGERLNAELLLSPAFRDMSVVPGGRYFYRVSAVDRSGNESTLSPAILALVP